MDYYDLTYDEILNIHLEVEDRFPNMHKGVQQSGLLKSIAKRPSQQHYNLVPYPDIYSKCASLMEGIIQWHPFFDGNKRTGLLVASYYMYKNKCMLVTPLSAIRFSVLVAEKKKNFQDIKTWIQSLTAHNSEEYSSKLKQYIGDPVSEIISLYKRGEADHDIAAIRKADEIINDWLALDIYPEYRVEEKETMEFLTDLLKKFPVFPF